MKLSLGPDDELVIDGPDGAQYRVLVDQVIDHEGRSLAELPAELVTMLRSFCKIRMRTKEANAALEGDVAFQSHMDQQAARLWAMLPIGRPGTVPVNTPQQLEFRRQFDAQRHAQNHEKK